MKASWQLRVPVVLFMLWIAYRVALSGSARECHNIFSAIDLGIHELGHVITCFLPELICAAAGTIAQCAAPLAAAYMFYRQKAYFEVCFGLFWCGENMISSSYYIGDAKSMNLRLVTPFGGEPKHDWNFILMKLGLLRWDTTIAFFVRAAGTVLVLGGILLGIAVLWAMRERDQGRRAPGLLGDLVDQQ